MFGKSWMWQMDWCGFSCIYVLRFRFSFLGHLFRPISFRFLICLFKNFWFFGSLVNWACPINKSFSYFRIYPNYKFIPVF
jgi:hypothetical protein